MAKLATAIENKAVGREGLVHFCNELNQFSVGRGSNVRHTIRPEGGKWALHRLELPKGARLDVYDHLDIETLERRFGQHNG